jgi:hypothetical protein
MTIAETMCRKFWWHTFMTWPDLLPKATIVVLSAMDNLVPMPEVPCCPGYLHLSPI